MTLINSYGKPLDVNKGLIYNVEFDDGSTRRMRKLVEMFRLCHAWVDLSTSDVVTMSWLIVPGKSSPKLVRFSNPEADFTPAFGGAFIKTMSLDIEVGGNVSWASQAGGSVLVKSGLVEEVVPVGGLPDRERFPQLYKSSGIGLPRKQKSYVVRAPGKTPKSAETVYWPRVSSLFEN